LNLYRIIQEQLQNIIKHSNAARIELSVRLFSNVLRLRIYDNGKGFNTKHTTSGIGLRNIKNRTEMFHGFCIINSSEGKGCEILIKIPVS
jgi:signal transduction histidine kinase